LAVQHRVAAENTRVAVGKPYLTAFKSAHRTIVIVSEPAVFSKRQTWNSLVAAVGFDGAQQLAKSDLAFAAHNKINQAAGLVTIGFRRHARIITAHDDSNAWPKRAQ